jgi:Domain of unknown function (DUF1707)
VATGAWDPARPGQPGQPGSGRFLASDADRERAIDVLKTAFVRGMLTRDELGARTGHALTARTYAELAAVTSGLTARPPEPAEPRTAQPRTAQPRTAEPRSAAQPGSAAEPSRTAARKRMNKKVVALGTCAVVLPPALGAAFLSSYGGFLVMFLLTFLGTVLTSKPPAPPRTSRRR